MKSILIFAASMLLSVSAFANTKGEKVAAENKSVSVDASVKAVQLTGSIMDNKNKETLVGATVHVDGKKYYSDLDGNFCISDVKPGKHQIKVELISYRPTTVEIDVNKDEAVNIGLNQN